MNELAQYYLSDAIKKFRELKSLGDRAFAQIKDEDFFFAPDEDTNSLAIIIRHLSGNMLSRWTDFLTTDGEKEWRNRDEEFEQLFYTDEEDLIQRWEKGWKCLFDALEALTPDDLMMKVKIRGEDHLVIEAINRQLTHYAYHTGQIVYMAKYLAKENWTSLSIAKSESKKFNDDMKGKHGEF